MKLKHFVLGAVMPLAMFAVTALPAFAATDHAIAEPVSASNPTACAQFYDGSTRTDGFCTPITINTATKSQDLTTAVETAIQTYAASQGYTTPLPIFWQFDTPNQVAAAIATATSTLVLPQAMSFGTSTRSLNSAFQVSSTRATFVSDSVDVATTLNLSGGAQGTVSLQYADDSGFTTNVKTINSATSGNTGTLTIGLALTQTQTVTLSGVIPAGKYERLVTANTVGTPTFTFRAAQEVLLGSN